jgi:protein-L-isoaspartate(D-aspartate) O-methyltransferase
MNFEQARFNMVLNQLRANRIRDIDLIEKIEDFPREDLFPKDLKHLSYSDQIITLDQGRFILPPLTSSHLVQCLELNSDDKVLEVGSGIGTITSILNQYTTSIDCIESSEVLIEIFKKSLSDNLFHANLLKTSIESFFSNKNPNINKYNKIIINGSLDVEPSQIIKKASENAIIVCVIDNKEIKHKIVKYVKVNNNCNQFIVEEALSNYLYKFITKEPFVF